MTTTSRLHLPAVALCLVLLVTGCGSVETPGTISASEPAPSVISSTAGEELLPGEGTFVTAADADRSDADSTAEVAALMLHSWDTLTDRTQTAAAMRAKVLMNGEWAGSQIEPERNGAQGEWLKPSQHQAYSSPSIIPAAGDVSRDVAEDKAIRVYDASWRWISRDGTEIQPAGHQIVTVYLEKHESSWSVVGHQLQIPTSNR